jgi:hypothetical protein
MTTVLQGIMTNKGRELLAKSFGSVGGFSLKTAISFGYGEGGFTVSGGGKVPKTPDPTLLNLEAASLPAPDNYIYGHDFTAADITFIAPSTIEFRCRLVPSEANTDGSGNLPKFFELGIFDGAINSNNIPQGNMLCYTTFDEQTKSATKSLISYIQVVF